MTWIEDTKARFPGLFRDIEACDFGVEEGWQTIIENLCLDLELMCIPWMRLWQRAANELLRLTPPSTIQLPGADAQTAAVLNILDLGMQDVEAGRVESLEEVMKRIRHGRNEGNAHE